MLKYTTETFILKANEIHKNKYDYSKTEYKGSTNKIIIICKKHGEFKQPPSSHLQKHGCKKCVNENQTKNIEWFLNEAHKIHGEKYDYSIVNYVNYKTYVNIICKNHGIFKQRPMCHLNGQICKLCSIENRKDTTKTFISKANIIHDNKYDYSKVHYICTSKKVTILCKIHGEFKQTPANHLKKRNCPKCVICYYSKQQIEWLNFVSKYYNIYIQHAENEGELYIEQNGIKKVDGYCKETNTIYEYHGNYWHGNPKIYNPENINFRVKKKYGELYNETIKKEEKIKNAGYNLIVMWESEWKKINKSISKLQRYFKWKKNNK